MRRRPLQTVFTFPSRGGRRKGAGRKPAGKKAGVSHAVRAPLASRFPVHVTLRVRSDVPRLRTKPVYRLIRRCIIAAGREGFRVVHHSVQGNHLHLIVEAKNSQALSRGMQGLSVRLARRLNGLFGRKGSVFADRYHARILRTPSEVRAALGYVLLNFRRHAREHGRTLPRLWLDPFSSAFSFDGWKPAAPDRRLGCCARAPSRGAWDFGAAAPPAGDRDETGLDPLPAARTWLLNVGWRRRGLLRPWDVPGPRRG